MPATPQWYGPISTGPSTVFPAQFAGDCAGCGVRFEPGDEVQYRDDELCIAHECDPSEHVSNGAEFNTTTPGRAPGIPVLPRGKTGKDRCDQCFIVHASGQVECE